MPSRTGFYWDSRFAWIDVGNGPFGPSNTSAFLPPNPGTADPSIKRRAYELIEATGLLKQLHRVEPTLATRQDLELFHTSSYLEQIEAGDQQPCGHDLADGTSHFGRGNYEIARLAVGAGLQLTEKVMKGELNNAFGLINPPSHHAAPAQGQGFCMFNTGAICAEAALQRFGAKRVAIVDFDVHHGNGTETGFLNRSDVLTISIHQDRSYPYDTGQEFVRGEGAGKGFNLNIPLPAGAGNHVYTEAFERVIRPALEAFRPDLIIAAAGVDANIVDSLGRQLVTSTGFSDMTKALMSYAERLCHGRLVMLQEGGYSFYVPYCISSIVGTLAGVKQPDPCAQWMEQQAGVWDYHPHHRAVVEQLAELDFDAMSPR